jgi:hypothetical protein
VNNPSPGDENSDERPEVRWSSDADDSTTLKLKDAFYRSGLEVCRGLQRVPDLVKLTIVMVLVYQVALTKLKQFVSELREGGPVKPGATSAPEDVGRKLQPPPQEVSGKLKLSDTSGTEPHGGSKKTAGKSLKLKEKFYARPSDIYECFTIEGKVSDLMLFTILSAADLRQDDRVSVPFLLRSVPSLRVMQQFKPPPVDSSRGLEAQSLGSSLKWKKMLASQ